MCAVSNIGDWGRHQWPNFPAPAPATYPYPYKPSPGSIDYVPPYNGPTKEQFEEFLKLLRAAKKFDDATGQKDCEQPEKVDWIKAMAKHLGVPAPVDIFKDTNVRSASNQLCLGASDAYGNIYAGTSVANQASSTTGQSVGNGTAS